MNIITPQEASLPPQVIMTLNHLAKLCVQCVCSTVSTFASSVGEPGHAEYLVKTIITELKTLKIQRGAPPEKQ